MISIKAMWDEEDIAWEKIEAFWDWFENNENRIIDILEGYSEQDKENLVNALNNQVLQFGMFTWEIGYGNSRPYSLTISPNGSRELLQISKALIAASPQLHDWEFHPAKGPRDWDLKFQVFDDDLNEHHINASGWRFTLVVLSEEEANVMIEAPNLSGLDEDTQHSAANLVVTSLLGEELRIQHVRKIELVHDLKDKARRIQNLRNDFEELLGL